MDMNFDHQLIDEGNKILSGKLTNNNYAHLRIFNDGLQLDLCVEPCAKFGKLLPSKPLGQIIKLGSIRDLKAKGLIVGEPYFRQGVEYKRFTISELGQSVFENYKNECSNG
ncbi:hypothetical protein HII17_13420 [Thalassotalea sp. M1531]|uniref:Uncharacterized protein n=1 Tax=Thalassotalea algicola TaxID=2716224 RepID=A0A7Y0LG34_9GAMM|nr:hypothetical protein [Thalassotalea algicola]NMP32560.1 hypothetical protein [Thalassotalea algicola]